MKLFASLASPYARKVRIALAEKKIECEFVEEDVWSPNTQVTLYNPLGKVPVLVLDDGTPLYDSRVIVEHLDAASPVGRLIPDRTRDRVVVRRWEALADGVLDAGILVRLERKRPLAKQDSDWVSRQLAKVLRGIKAASEDLGERTWCTGEAFNLADIALGCMLLWLEFRMPEITWRKDYTNLARLLEKLEKRQSFKDTVPPPSR
jgi:glutathione S-transferase